VGSDPGDDQPCYVISVAAKMVGVHPQTLRNYESLGLVKPCRTPGNKRLYSPSDIERLRHIQRLTGELGVNLAGVEAILALVEKMERMEAEMAQLRQQFESEAASLKSSIANPK
jgi:MerR family transcriptional regulator/heat shock protein HspR